PAVHHLSLPDALPILQRHALTGTGQTTDDDEAHATNRSVGDRPIGDVRVRAAAAYRHLRPKPLPVGSLAGRKVWVGRGSAAAAADRKSTRLNSSHVKI